MTQYQVPASPNTAINAATVTPSDTNYQAVPFRALWVGGAGNVAIVMSDGSVVTFTGVAAGYMLPVGGVRVNATGTTATAIVAVY
jgi:hypothetical protein